MRLRLINPAPAGNRARNGNADMFSIVPLQLVTVASYASAHGWDVEIQDEIVEDLRFEGAIDLVGISVKACTAKRAYEIGRRYREQGVPVLMGGAHVSLIPELSAPHADALVRGGIEENIGAILNDAASGQLKPRYEDTSAGNLPHGRLRWDLVAKNRYRVYSVVATRGCPMRCSFCSIPGAYDYKVRARPVEDVVDDIARAPASYFILWDEHPTADPHYAEVFFRALTPLHKTWFGEATSTVDRNPRLLSVMGKSGCRGLYLGVESFNQTGLNKVKKGFNRVEHYRDLVKRLNDNGIAAHAGVVFGFDGDDESIFERTYEGLHACGFNSASFKILTPYPGTPFHTTMQSEGRIFDENLDHYDENHVVFRPKSISIDALYEGYRRVTKEFYAVPDIFRRIARGAVRGVINYYPIVANFGWRRAYYHDLSLYGSL